MVAVLILDNLCHISWAIRKARKTPKTIQKHLARKKRQRELLDCKDDFSHSPYYRDGICRDERVVERHGQLNRDTNMWSNNEQDRKRMKLTQSNNFGCLHGHIQES